MSATLIRIADVTSSTVRSADSAGVRLAVTDDHSEAPFNGRGTQQQPVQILQLNLGEGRQRYDRAFSRPLDTGFTAELKHSASEEDYSRPAPREMKRAANAYRASATAGRWAFGTPADERMLDITA